VGGVTRYSTSHSLHRHRDTYHAHWALAAVTLVYTFSCLYSLPLLNRSFGHS
jgi:hypothetical protein